MKTSWLSRLSRPKSRSPRRSLQLRSAVESLEDRSLPSATVYVVPLVQAVDATHRHTLADAMPIAGTFGKVVIEPGATPDAGVVNVTLNDLIIAGDASVACGSLPQYDIAVSTNGVILEHMNLGDVTEAATAFDLTIYRSQFHNFTELGAASGVGHNDITHNIITGSVDLQGNSGAGQATSDIFGYNQFVSAAPVLLKVTNSNSTSIFHNSFVGDSSNQIAIQVRSNSDGVAITNNDIKLSGAGMPIGICLINTGGAAGNILGAQVLDNVVNTGGVGIGLYMNIFGTGQFFTAQVEGNEFHNNHVGVDINGVAGATGAGNIDLGGGSNGFGASKGGNNFRGFDGVGGHFAIHLHNTDAGISVFAQKNIFDTGVDPNLVVQDGSNGGTGVLDVSNSLDPNHAFVQTLFTNLLGRAGDTAVGAEVDQWVAKLPKLGRKGVAKAILYGDESLGRRIDQICERFLNRSASGVEKATWIPLLKKGVNTSRFEAAILGTSEYASHVNMDYVSSIYLNVLHRPATATELAKGYAALPSLGLRGFAASITGGKERRLNFTNDLYRNLLHREPVGTEASTLASKTSNLLTLQLLVLSGDEFYSHG